MAGPYRTSQDRHTTNNRLYLRVLYTPEVKRDIDRLVRCDNPSSDVQLVPVHALTTHPNLCAKSLSVRGERDYLMQIVCGATPSCLAAVYKLEPSGVIKIMTLHYDKMTFYVGQVLFWL
ncbi:hypothetical protein EDD16DRAFT_1618825 [Pisolithus croceorrhizus]|nr:hypothetical protein EDD16DRAFT_1618825 [Pisolithus croceorrhizus]KAI6149083.1 hypothetical protein EDD17DRAFT_1642785 [Pisolithus thermaeus]